LSSFNLFKIKACNMSFAKNHMYKQGWVEGKGLGRYETGMKSAIKVKIKRDQAGMGHDMAEEFTFQWWDHVFNRAASKIKLKGEDDSDASSSEDEPTVAGGSFDISNKKPTKKKYDPKQILYGRFVSGGLLVDENNDKLREIAEVKIDSNGGVVLPATAPSAPSATNSNDDDSSDDDDEDEIMKLYAAAGLSEQELLMRCGGRTAHKGARHGLKASAKLARIERQEGVAKAATPVTLDVTSPPPVAAPTTKKEKKRKKHEALLESSIPTDDPPNKKRKKMEKTSMKCTESLIVTNEIQTQKKKKKKTKKLEGENIKTAESVPSVAPGTETPAGIVKDKKKKKEESGYRDRAQE